MSGVTVYPPTVLSEFVVAEEKKRLFFGETTQIDGDTISSAVYRVPSGYKTKITDLILRPLSPISTFYMAYGATASPAASVNPKPFWYYEIVDGDAAHYSFDLNVVMAAGDYLWVGSDYTDSVVWGTTPDYYSGTGSFMCSVMGVEVEI